MTPEQTKRRIPVMQKFGEPGWMIEYRPYGGKVWAVTETPTWDDLSTYRAVRVEATPGKHVPLPWSTIKCGMVVRYPSSVDTTWLILRASSNYCTTECKVLCDRDLLAMEHLDGSTWKPLWTEESGIERIVEVISEEVV